MIKKLTVLLIIFLVFSCVPKKNITYLQNIENQDLNIKMYETILKPDDLLRIEVRTLDKEISDLYNPTNTAFSAELQGYLINKNGYITFPLIGDIKAAGLTKEQFKQNLNKELSKQIKNFTIDLRLLNFSVNVIGEVLNPGNVRLIGERVTLLEALARAGDLTILGNRKNIKIIRTIDDKVVSKIVDITNPEFIKSDFYYLTQNDIVIVDPRRQKADGTALGTNVTTTVSIISSLLTIYLIIKNI